MPRTFTPVLLILASAMLVGAQQSSGTPASGQTPAGATQQTAPAGAPKRPMIPDTFTNLKVLPPDIKKQDLMSMMKAMSIGLKVRCSNCHVATDDLSEADFPSDEKPTKVAAREMLRTLFDARAKYPMAAPAAAQPAK